MSHLSLKPMISRAAHLALGALLMTTSAAAQTVPQLSSSAPAVTASAAAPAKLRRLPLFVGGTTLAGWIKADRQLFATPGIGTVVAGKGGIAARVPAVLSLIAQGRYQILHIQPDHLRDGAGRLDPVRAAVERLARAAESAGMKVVLARPLSFGAPPSRDDEALADWMKAEALARGYQFADYRHVDFHPEIAVDSPARLGLVSNTLRGALDAAFRAVPGMTGEAVAQRERERVNALPDGPGSGPYPAIHGIEPALPGAVLYRPANLALFTKTRLPVLIFGNGGCMGDGNSARLLLTEIASHGYLVIAPGAMLDGPGGLRGYPEGANVPADQPGRGVAPADMVHVLDWASAPASSNGGWADFVDAKRIGVAGWSCGGLLALGLAPDPRIRTTIVFDSGLFPAGEAGMPGLTVDKSTLGQLHAPILYLLGGITDVAYTNGTDDFARIDRVPAVLASRDVGHSGTFFEPNGGLWAIVARRWLDWQLKGDDDAAADFASPGCRLCSDPSWTIRRNARVVAP